MIYFISPKVDLYFRAEFGNLMPTILMLLAYGKECGQGA